MPRIPLLKLSTRSAVVVCLTALGVTLARAQAPVEKSDRTPLTSGANATTPRKIAPAPAPERIQRIDRFLQSYVDQDRVGGAVALVLRNGRPVYQKAVGWRDRESRSPMAMDTIFRIASQTKAITSAAAMMLVEEGAIGLGDPVSRFIPAFARTTVRTAVDGPIVPATRQILIKDLLTHTSGISYGTDPQVEALYAAKGLGSALGSSFYTAEQTEPICATMERLATLPFVAQPGEAYVYGYSIDVLGCVVERASGMPLDRFIRTRITEPLGMTDTHFYLPPAKRGRLAVVYGSGPAGRLIRAPEGPTGQGAYVDGPRVSFAGGAGLLATAGDYARFLEMIRNGGVSGGRRFLSARAVALMTTNQIGARRGPNGLGYGYGFETTDRYGAKDMDSVGAFGWGGAYGSIYRVDPASGLVIVLMFNMMPNNTDLRDKFPTLVYQAF